MPNPHTLTAYQVQSTTLFEGGRNAFAAFHYNPKAPVRFSESFKKGICLLEENTREVAKFKNRVGIAHYDGMTKI